jgi:hypothetical protein
VGIYAVTGQSTNHLPNAIGFVQCGVSSQSFFTNIDFELTLGKWIFDKLRIAGGSFLYASSDN